MVIVNLVKRIMLAIPIEQQRNKGSDKSEYNKTCEKENERKVWFK